MKIISWNCEMNFREKFKKISKLDADIYVIPECEDPKQSDNEEYKSFASNSVWIGDNKNKGLGIFAKDNIILEPIQHNTNSKYFLPVKINNSFNLIAVWTRPDKSGVQYYPEEILKFYKSNEFLFDENLIICGDFNCDMSLDGTHAKNFHSVIEILEKHKLKDIYHYVNDEDEGYERQATWYPYNPSVNPRHLDHAFAKSYIVDYFKILGERWLEFSDHLPFIFEIMEPLKTDTKMKICPYCDQLYLEKEECPKCNIELKTIEKFADDLNRTLEHQRGLHILYVDPSDADTDRSGGIKSYYDAYMTLIKADYQNRERYLYGLVKTYDILDRGKDYTCELDCNTVLEILNRLLEFSPNKLAYLRLKVIYSYVGHKYEDAVKYYEKILEMGIEDEWCKAYYERALDRLHR